MNSENTKIFLAFKERSREGEYAPIRIEEDSVQGFVAKAYEDIPKYTLISEYSGEVTKLNFIRREN